MVEDDQALRDTLTYNLTAEGYRVLTAADGVTALDLAGRERVALVLLDVMLPRLDGLSVCRRLRASPTTAQTPILMLTARGDETDKVVGLELGADDYVTKPFGWAELRARIRALLRRGEQAGAAERAESEGRPPSRALVADHLHIDLERREVRRDGREIELPARLFDLLVYMVRNRGVVLTRERILRQVWGYDYDFIGETRTVDVHVRWLREKIEDDPARPTRIVTVRGVGYRFR
ncbi:MAG TPA: response regulator transcription factor [Ktedonobacterales bacterium]|nr:response regulator transcription factor [Ktedonobacterales bacterium]